MSEINQRFDSFQQWVNKASSWLTRHPEWDEKRFRAICFDIKGRQCRIGSDFMRARDEDAFPVHWVWPDQVPAMALAQMAAAEVPAEAAR